MTMSSIQQRIGLFRQSASIDAAWYVGQYPDVGLLGMDPVEHYARYGERLRRSPSPAFDVRYYLQAYPDVALSGVSPLEHYICNGRTEGRHPRPAAGFAATTLTVDLTCPADLNPFFFAPITQSGLFDPVWYVRQYQDRFDIGTNPLAHYLAHGVREGVNPSPGFDTRYYLESNPDVADSDMHPFVHYVLQGKKEGRLPVAPEYRSRHAVSEPRYVARLAPDTPPPQKAVRVIAFYLPQFHAIPENDAWWGKGFTEWSNVKPAVAQFAGHYQPHVPDDFMGCYNLLDRGAQAKQVELAKQYGVEGFCFYLYWFSGQRLLEQPLDNYLSDPSLDLPFCVCWANENWSRRWDGLENDLLMVQHYSEQDDIDFISSVAKYLHDPRYIRVNGKPLLMVYRPNLFPDMKATARRWRDWCRDHGLGEIYLAYPQSFECVDPAVYGFDAATEFPPNNSNPPSITREVTPVVENFGAKIYDWRVFIDRSESYQDPGYKLFRAACPSWDNTARKKTKGTVFHHSCPDLFTRWLTNAFSDTLARIPDRDEQIVFVNAWNEWAEGAHLEPDQRHGYAWLQAVRDAHQAALHGRKRVLVVSHDAHPHGAQILCLNMARHFKEQLHFDVEMIVLGDGRLLPRYEEHARVHRVDLDQADPRELQALLTSLRNKGVELAIVNTTVSGGIVPHLKAQGFSVVSLVHEMPGILSRYRLQEQSAHIAKLADKVVFPADQVKQGFEDFVGHALGQATVRPQGLYLPSLLRDGADKDTVRASVRARLGLPARARIIMCAGYADHRKGFDLFVQACTRVALRMPDTYALWVGHLDQGFVDESLKTADAAGMRDRFLFTGLVDRPQEYYVAADIYALTSREDPFPSVVMEALDALTPVVAFKDCGGFDSLLKRDCGLLVQAEDHAALGDALIGLLQDPPRATAMAEAGRQIVESEFSFRNYLFDLLALAGRPLPRVSVVVPNYKYERYIRQRLETVVNQAFPIFELIVLDDCSPDSSVAVIQDFLRGREVPHRLVVNASNSGSVFKQWQKGVRMARGDLVWIAEADDLAEPEFLQKLLPFFDDPEVVLAYSQSKQIDQDGKLLANDYLAYTNDIGDYWRDDYVIPGGQEIGRALCIKNTIPNVSGVVFRRDQLARTLDSEAGNMMAMKVAGDWMLYLSLVLTGKVAYCASALNVHRRHVGSVTNVNNHLQEIIAVQELAARLVTLEPPQLQEMTSYVKKLNAHFERSRITEAEVT